MGRSTAAQACFNRSIFQRMRGSEKTNSGESNSRTRSRASAPLMRRWPSPTSRYPGIVQAGQETTELDVITLARFVKHSDRLTDARQDRLRPRERQVRSLSAAYRIRATRQRKSNQKRSA